MKAKLSPLQLKDIQIIRLNLDENIKGEKKFNIDVDFEPVKVNIDEKEYEGLIFHLKVNNRSRKVRLKVDTEALAIFEFEKGLPPEKKAQLLLYNGLSIIYGFLRGLIFQKCSYLRPEDRLLPSINLLDIIDKKLKDKNNNS
ncbi:hypothetical protein [Persephonella sp. KM09-Lau-8]|uniref:hypothetical protein n=1 Tax=Persephonella sp. KM09-Lau-8 TaxID=1158345 RepID=UPI0004954046|nr:hypothetical protein [Persephonella sp. KM09-Lau-8]